MAASENLRKLAAEVTQGNWFVDEQPAAPLRVLADDDRRTIICTISGPATNHWSQAEARLVAAAPDMAVLLARALDALAFWLSDDFREPGEIDLQCTIDRAILADADRLFGNDTEKEERAE